MSDDPIRKKIIETMAVTFGVENSEITEAASMETIENWDSIRHMNLVVALEQNFEIEFEDDEILELLNLKLIEHIIRSKNA